MNCISSDTVAPVAAKNLITKYRNQVKVYKQDVEILTLIKERIFGDNPKGHHKELIDDVPLYKDFKLAVFKDIGFKFRKAAPTSKNYYSKFLILN